MQGFFSKKTLNEATRKKGKPMTCVSCGLLKNAKNPKIQPSGNFKKGILNVFPFPSNIEDKRGKAFVSKDAEYVDSMYKKIGISLEEDCLNTYAVSCYSDKIDIFSVDCCNRFLKKLIKEHQPKIIVLFGTEPVQSLIGKTWKGKLGDLREEHKSKWTGWAIPDQDLGCFIVPTFSPKWVMESDAKVQEVVFKKHFKVIEKCIQQPYFPKYEPPLVEKLTEDKLVILNTIRDCKASFDIETTGIKPHDKGHRIVCMSIAYTANNCYVFEIPRSRKARKPIIDFLQRQSVQKIAHNLKFEDTWCNVRLKTNVINWFWDTMLGTHIIDNRPGITGLKFQTYVQLGIMDYESEVSPYLKSKDDKNSNAHNTILELMENQNKKEQLFKYCALDSIFTYRIQELQEGIINKKQPIGSIYGANITEAMNLFMNGIVSLAKAERVGLRIDTDYCERRYKGLSKKIQRIEQKFFDSNFYKHWKKTFRKINLNSGDQLGKYLYEKKGIVPQIKTKTGKGSTNEEALRLLKIPELDLLLDRSKLLKIRDTYLKAFIREQVKGTLHPFYNLHTVRTYRSSSDKPNFQNIPSRDKEAMTTVRKAIFPRKGHQILEIDYKAIEVAIAECYHKDPTMEDYIVNDGDMHGDMASQIFFIKKFDKHLKEHAHLRKCTKNSFVFPQFYGDYYGNNAIHMCGNWLNLPQSNWKRGMGIEFNGKHISDHLIKNGINSFNDFVEHIKKIEKHFWTKRFPVYAQWKEDHYDAYLKNGYITLKTGFTCSMIMSKNDAINYPVQGAAFHCLLWTLNEITNYLEKNNFDTKVVGQIHDAIVLDVCPEELFEVYNIVQKIGTTKLKQTFKWINVPLQIEAELSPVDGSWAEKEEWEPTKEKEIFYYYHAESDSLWESYNDFEVEDNLDSRIIKQISRERFDNLCIEIGYWRDITGKEVESPF